METVAFNVSEGDSFCRIKQRDKEGRLENVDPIVKLEHKSRVSCKRANETRSYCAKKGRGSIVRWIQCTMEP